MQHEAKGKSDHKQNLPIIMLHIENAINEINAIRENGAVLIMPPTLIEARSHLYKLHEVYKRKLETDTNIPDEVTDIGGNFISLDFIGKSLKDAGGEIKTLFDGFIKKEFDWCETCSPYLGEAKHLCVHYNDNIRAYVTKGNNHGWCVKVEIFGETGSKQIFAAKTNIIKSAHKLSEMISSLCNDRLARSEINEINTVGPKSQHGYQSDIQKIAAKGLGSRDLLAAVSAVSQKEHSTGAERSCN